MSSERLPPAEIEAIKARVEETLEDTEAEWRALQAWLTEWRIRRAKSRALAGQEGA